MSQTGTVLSCAPQQAATGIAAGSNDGNNWNVLYGYQLDAGGIAQAEVIVGSGTNAAVALWASPTSTITVPNPPGTTNPVSLPCPDIIKWAACGVAIKGFPTA
jgi:hypothetical protein